MIFTTPDQGQRISQGERKALKDLEKLFLDEISLISFETENEHITRLWISTEADFEQEITINELPESIGKLKWLKELEVVDNELWDLPESIGNLESLQVLKLDDNPITKFPESIGNLTSLRELSLYHVRVSKFMNYRLNTLPESFGKLGLLEKLALSDNNLNTLPESFGNLKSLRKLNLSYNKLRALPDSFGNLKSLQELQLRGNKLRTLPESIGNLGVLQILDLSYNKLRMLPGSIGNLNSLKELNLEENLLKTLPDSLLKLFNLKKIATIDNPLSKDAQRILEHLMFHAYVDGNQTFFNYKVTLPIPLIERIDQYIAHYKEERCSSISELAKQAIQEKLKESRDIPASFSQEENTLIAKLSTSLTDSIKQYIENHEEEGYSYVPSFIKRAIQEKLERTE